MIASGVSSMRGLALGFLYFRSRNRPAKSMMLGLASSNTTDPLGISKLSKRAYALLCKKAGADLSQRYR